MWGIWILLFAVSLQDSSAITHREVTLMHSSTFKIKNLGLSSKVEFTDPDEETTTTLYSPFSKPKRGHVVAWRDHRDYIIKAVKFNDQGTYKVRSFWGSVTSSYALKVIAKMATINRVAGETLKISLEGLNKENITLRFISENDSLLLVEQGEVQVNNHSDYIGRIQVTNYDIRLLNFNVSDVGNYSISDKQERLVAITEVNLVDHHDGVNAAPFLSMLLGIPMGICFCFRKKIGKTCCGKKICKCCSINKERTGVVLNTTTVENPVSPPQGLPDSNNPNTPALNPIYPSLYPPAQPPQWSGTPNNAPSSAGFDPVIYNAPNALVPGPGQMQGSEISASTPLLPNPTTEIDHRPTVCFSVLNTSDSAVQYKPDMGKDSSTNFL